ncbi:hypothetical protein niasHS_005027 [Heterodera schachtii]|uniref:B30.2/SPRY domain-containing protein n=1 Tax=Heterodera schachtii TaxID=97005 RepID=A0ABD2JKB5_HETSC
MSISTSSINCGDDLTATEKREVNADAISLDNYGQLFDGKNSESITDQQQQLKLQEMMVEQKALKEKMAKIEQKRDKNANSDQFSKMQNDQKILLEKVNELEKEQKQKKALLNYRQNYWDANVCDEKLEIIGHKKLIVHYKGNINGWSSVFAKHPILLNNNSPDIFYFEISVKNIKSWYISFGFSIIQQTEFGWVIKKGTYAYDSLGVIWINGKRKEANDGNSYGVGATVGIGVNSATRQIFFTKNGLCLGFSDFYVAPSFADDSLHPFVSLFNPDDKIEANFGPNFKFDLAIL